jgi:hypothetical protein
MTDAEVAAFAERSSWRFAKTMWFMPHWYTVRRNAASDEEFSRFVLAIRERSVPEVFGKRTFRYLTVGDWKYWYMDPVTLPLAGTELVNRARVDPKSPESYEIVRVELEKIGRGPASSAPQAK